MQIYFYIYLVKQLYFYYISYKVLFFIVILFLSKSAVFYLIDLV